MGISAEQQLLMNARYKDETSTWAGGGKRRDRHISDTENLGIPEEDYAFALRQMEEGGVN